MQKNHWNFTLFPLAPGGGVVNVSEEMVEKDPPRRTRRLHVHKAVVTHAVRQRAGVPYEIEQHICLGCRSVLDERQLRRTAA